METHRRVFCFLVSLMVFGMLFVGGCKKTVSVNSRWASEEIVVDGQDSEWRNGGLYYDEKTNTKIGIRNDSQSLYICLIFKDGGIQRQILLRGFTLWVSQDKAKNKLWGLRYPVGGEGSGNMGGPAGNLPSGREGGPAGGEPGGQSGSSFMSLNEFELISSAEEPDRVVRSEELGDLGIDGRFSQQQGGGLVYEVKIPLSKTEQTPYAAVASRKGGYLIGFISEKAETQGMGSGGMRGGMGGGGMGGGGMGGGGMGGGGMGGMNFSDIGGGDMGGGDMGGDVMGGGGMGGGDMGRGGMGGTTASSLELWALIQLATAPGSGP